MRILVFNQKPGVGTTTTAVNLSAALAVDGQRVIAVDLHPDGTMASILGADQLVVNPPAGQVEASSTLVGESGSVQTITSRNGAVITFDPLEIESGSADWIIIDAPSQSVADIARIISGCDLVVYPMEPDANGMDLFDQLVTRLHEEGVSKAKFRILLNRYSNRLAQHRQARGLLIERYGSNLALPTVIRSSARLIEAFDAAQTIFHFAPKSTGAIDFAQLARILRSERSFAQKSRKDRP